MKLSKKKLELDYEGNVYNILFPNVSQVEMFQKKMSDKPEDVGLILDFLDELGLPKKVSKEMQVANLTTIIEHISGSKKN